MQQLQSVITVQNVYTREKLVVCEKHYDALDSDGWQVQHGWHNDVCWECEKEQTRAGRSRNKWQNHE